jgi:hypothetical protein
MNGAEIRRTKLTFSHRLEWSRMGETISFVNQNSE